MKKAFGLWALTALFSGLLFSNSAAPGDIMLYDIANGREQPLSALAPTLAQYRVVLVGEYHSEATHHQAQVAVVKALKAQKADVAIGLEMFRADAQRQLDQWVAGRISETDFKTIYLDNWNFPWPVYRVIFQYAQREKIPLLGLNTSRAITRQVARSGFQSLSAEQRQALNNITCDVDPVYMDYIRRAYGAHSHGQLNFEHFCEAQLVWDNIMAVHTVNYLRNHPESGVVIFTGTGHARKRGIPAQIEKRLAVPWVVILPEIPGRIDSSTLDRSDADYIMINLESVFD